MDVSGLGSLKGAISGDISVCFDKKSLTALQETKASACLLPKTYRKRGLQGLLLSLSTA
ncbi:MAG: hypothetical protein H6925_05800 [Holosporaceae bacterium]|nr:MAG: hypothetical protein H6925_05800 [Holosporaceae bacterium]